MQPGVLSRSGTEGSSIGVSGELKPEAREEKRLLSGTGPRWDRIPVQRPWGRDQVEHGRLGKSPGG